MDLFSLSGKVAVVTGGAGVLGSAIARGMAQAGAKVAILGHDENSAEAVAAELNAAGGEAEGFPVDVLDLDVLRSARYRVLERFGRVDILINSAGGNKPSATVSSEQSFFDISSEAFQDVINLNLLGTIYATQVFGEVMAEQSSGCVLNISSMTAFNPLTNVVAYSAAKAAVSNFTQWMSVHFAQKYGAGIRVNAIAPGFFSTKQNRYLLEDETGKRTKRGQKIIDRTPMGRFGVPEDLVGAALFLCSDAARFITGVVLPVDGGFSAYAGV